MPSKKAVAFRIESTEENCEILHNGTFLVPPDVKIGTSKYDHHLLEALNKYCGDARKRNPDAFEDLYVSWKTFALVILDGESDPTYSVPFQYDRNSRLFLKYHD